MHHKQIRAYDSITCPVISEKATYLSQFNKYVFKVSMSATKHSVASALKEIYEIDEVLSVNTMIRKGKVKFSRNKRSRVQGRRADVKLAVVTLPAGIKLKLK